MRLYFNRVENVINTIGDVAEEGNMIPESKQIVVKKALQTTFGVDQYDSIQAIEVDLSNALTFRKVVKNKPYLMKIVRSNEINSPKNHFDYIKVAAEYIMTFLRACGKEKLIYLMMKINWNTESCI